MYNFMELNFDDKSPLFAMDRDTSAVFVKNSEEFMLFMDTVNAKGYTAKYSDLSYRQINSLGQKNLFPDFRKSDKEWRTFSLKELVYLKIVSKLRVYGFKDAQLISLRKAFFSRKSQITTDMALFAVFKGVRIIMMLNNKFQVSLHSEAAFNFIESFSSTFINVNLNEIMIEVWNRLGNEGVEYKNGYDILRQFRVRNVNDKELEILNIIRDKDYKTITIRKNEKHEFIVKGEKMKELTEKELLDIIAKKDFVDINIVKRNGNIVNTKVEDNFKI